MIRPRVLLVGLLLVFAVVLLSRNLLQPDPGGVSTDTPFRSFKTDVMYTTVDVQVPDRPGSAAAAEAVFEVFRLLDVRLNEWREDSPLGDVNRNAGGDPVEVPDDLRLVVAKGIELGDATGGAFDITWAALWGLWNFTSTESRVPAAAEIEPRVQLVDYRRIELDEKTGTIRLPEAGMKIGLGGIAKGYALGLAAAELETRGITDFLIVAGGQVLAGGKRHARPWRVGIRDPRGPAEDFFAYLEIENQSLSTSGDYERYFVMEGSRYHHILDPRTGHPARGVRSATVIAADPTEADALSTAFVVVGVEEALAISRRRGVDVILVDGDGKVHTSEGFEGKLLIRHPPRPALGEP